MRFRVQAMRKPPFALSLKGSYARITLVVLAENG